MTNVNLFKSKHDFVSNRKFSFNGFAIEYHNDAFNDLVLNYAAKCGRNKTWENKKIDFEHTLLKQKELSKNDDCIKNIIYYNNNILFYSTKISPFTLQKVIDAFNEARRTLIYAIQKDKLITDNYLNLNDILVADFNNESTELDSILIIETIEKEINMSKKDVSTVTTKSSSKKKVTKEYGKVSDNKETEKKVSGKKDKDKSKETLSDKATKKLNSEKSKKK